MNPDFGGMPLVVGSLTGVRAFLVRVDGRLGSPVWAKDESPYPAPGPWKARCHWVRYGDCYDERDNPYYGHRRCADTSICDCGFYAWFKRAYASHDREANTVTALVEGYGTCQVGDKGFRAEQMRLLGFIERKNRGISIRQYAVRIVLLFICTILPAHLFLSGLWENLGLIPWFIGIGYLSFVVSSGGGDPVKRNYDIAELGAAYSVPVYPSLRKAFKAHPPTRLSDLPKGSDQ